MGSNRINVTIALQSAEQRARRRLALDACSAADSKDRARQAAAGVRPGARRGRSQRRALRAAVVGLARELLALLGDGALLAGAVVIHRADLDALGSKHACLAAARVRPRRGADRVLVPADIDLAL